MSRLKDFKEKQKKFSRFQTLKSVFSSLIITTTAIVVAAVIIPRSPEAKIDNLDIYNNSIVYTINITDEDNAIISGTLQLQLINQFECYEKEIDLGLSSGIFEELNEDTQYTLKILADKGFGLEVLESKKITTYPNTGGSISSYNIDSSSFDWLDYRINYFISDPQNEYISVNLRYATKAQYETEFLNYQTIVLNKLDDETLIQQIFNQNLEVNLILEATLLNNDVIELDNIIFHTPFKIYGSVYLYSLTNDKAILSIWAEPIENLEVKYEIRLKQGDFILRRIEYDIPDYDLGQAQFEEPLIEIDNLYQKTDYQIELVATYDNPYTLSKEEEVISFIEFTTLENFEYQYSIEEFDTYYEITITLDENAVFDIAYISIYEYVNGAYTWPSQATYRFTVTNNQKEILITLNKPIFTEYKIEIGIRDDDFYYYQLLLDTIENLLEE